MNMYINQVLFLLASASIVWSSMIVLLVSPKAKTGKEYAFTLNWFLILIGATGQIARVLETGWIPQIDAIVLSVGIGVLVRLVRKSEEAKQISRATTKVQLK